MILKLIIKRTMTTQVIWIDANIDHEENRNYIKTEYDEIQILGYGYYALQKDGKWSIFNIIKAEEILNGCEAFERSANVYIFELEEQNQNELKSEGYPEQFTYLLPSNELASKYMAISAYNGSFSISRLKDFGFSKEYLNEILDFCISEGLLYKGKHDRVFVSRKGVVWITMVYLLMKMNINVKIQLILL